MASELSGAAARSLDGKVVIITGAGSGMGKAACALATEAGAKVAAVDIRGQDETAAALAAAGQAIKAYKLDITDADGWSRLVESVGAEFGAIDGLANVAGVIAENDGLLTQTIEGWNRLISVDLMGTWLGMRAVVPQMLERGAGRIVNVASVCGLIGIPNTIAYSAAKGGVISMSRQVAIEYAAQGLRINCIAPGVVETPMLGDTTEAHIAAVKSASPSRRIGTPEDIAQMIIYLLTPAAEFVTGQVFTIDGGWTAG